MVDYLSKTGLLLSCPECSFCTQKFTKLMSHVITNHVAPTKIQLFKCHICNNISTCEDLVKEHVNVAHPGKDENLTVGIWSNLIVNQSIEDDKTDVLYKLAPNTFVTDGSTNKPSSSGSSATINGDGDNDSDSFVKSEKSVLPPIYDVIEIDSLSDDKSDIVPVPDSIVNQVINERISASSSKVMTDIPPEVPANVTKSNAKSVRKRGCPSKSGKSGESVRNKTKPPVYNAQVGTDNDSILSDDRSSTVLSATLPEEVPATSSNVKIVRKRGRPSKSEKPRESIENKTKPSVVDIALIGLDDDSILSDDSSSVTSRYVPEDDQDRRSSSSSSSSDDVPPSSSSGSICMEDLDFEPIPDARELCTNRVFLCYVRDMIIKRYELSGVTPTSDRVEKVLTKFVSYIMNKEAIGTENVPPPAPTTGRGRGGKRGRGRGKRGRGISH